MLRSWSLSANGKRFGSGIGTNWGIVRYGLAYPSLRLNDPFCSAFSFAHFGRASSVVRHRRLTFDFRLSTFDFRLLTFDSKIRSHKRHKRIAVNAVAIAKEDVIANADGDVLHPITRA